MSSLMLIQLCVEEGGEEEDEGEIEGLKVFLWFSNVHMNVKEDFRREEE